jgi:hypothetical protein
MLIFQESCFAIYLFILRENTSQALVVHASGGTQEAEIRRIVVRYQRGQIVCNTLSQKTLHKKKKRKIGLIEWLKVKARFQALVPHTHTHTHTHTQEKTISHLLPVCMPRNTLRCAVEVIQ